MKKLLLIAFYFNQKNEIASKRLRGLAKYFPFWGYETIVITPNLGDSTAVNNLHNQTILNSSIIETEYEDMLDKWMKPFKSNIKVSTSSTNPNNDSKNHALLNKAISIAGELFAFPDGMKYWYEPAIKAASDIIEKEEIQGIISSSWPITSHIIAKNLKKQFDLPWIADLRDLWNGNPYISHNFIRNRMEWNLEMETFKAADVLTTTTELAASKLKEIHPNHMIVPILSGFDPDDLKTNNGSEYNINNNNNNNNPKLTLLYAGSLYKGKRDPSILFDALNQLIKCGKIDSSKIAINFYGDDFALEDLAKKYDLLDIVNIKGYISHTKILTKEMSSDLLILLSWDSEKEKMFIPGKIYEYMIAKRPVLSIGHENGSLKDLIEKTNIGFHTSTIDEVKIAIMDYYNEYIENGKITYIGNSYVNEYSMLNTAKNFADILNGIIK
ncbi:glycosyltransferase family protein [Methanobrevibacter filiformis]|nr:hypothetical protein [Methanobrevibacter filiformis]